MVENRSPRRPFTVELQMRRRAHGGEASADAGGDAGMTGLREELNLAMESLRAELRHDVKALLTEHKVLNEPPAPTPPPEADAVRQMSAEEELAMLKAEIRQLSETIDRTKEEIAALYHTSKDFKRIDVMRDELGAVVKDTEIATGSILESMEVIDETAQYVKSVSAKNQGVAEVGEAADTILDQVVRVFETCNFQDLTGQRITKVVNTLKFIEERVQKLVSVWGEGELDRYQSQEVLGNDDLEKTLSETSTTSEKVTQDEIDKMFG